MAPSVRVAGGLDDRKGWLRGLVRSFVHGDGFEVAVRAVVGAGDGRGIVVQAIDGRGGHGGLGFVRAVVGRGRPAQDSLVVLEDGLDAPSVLRLVADDERGLASSSGGDELEDVPSSGVGDLGARSAPSVGEGNHSGVVPTWRRSRWSSRRCGRLPVRHVCEMSLDLRSGEGPRGNGTNREVQRSIEKLRP